MTAETHSREPHGTIVRVFETSPVVVDGVMLKYATEVACDDGRVFSVRERRRNVAGVRVWLKIADGTVRMGGPVVGEPANRP